MVIQLTEQENRKFKKRVSNSKWIANTFLAGVLSGAITLGIMQGCKEKLAEKPNLETKIQSVEDVNQPNIINYVEDVNQPNIIDYKTNDFSQDSDEVLLARMIYGESRNCSKNERIAVAYSVINRVNDRKKWNGENIKDVILKPWQYSCFNKNDVNLKKLKNPNKKIFEDCLEIAGEVLEGKYSELNKGQTHYFNPKVVKPKWADKLEKVDFEKTKHEFYREN